MLYAKQLLFSTSLLIIGSMGAIAQPCLAQDNQSADHNPRGDSNEADNPSDDVTNKQVYEPAYFEQYSPHNALDMVREIPGFSISRDNNNQRGLGQANDNVLVNGERFSGKSDGVREQLRRIPASDVVRIEVVDGTVLDIPGLTGQIANVIVESAGLSGQFRYDFGFRAHNTEAQYYGGEASFSGKSGALDYTVAFSNPNHRFGADGQIILTDADGMLIETQESKFSGKFDNPKLSTNFSYDFSSDITANLNLSYGEDFFSRNTPETGFPVNGPVRHRQAEFQENGPEYEIGGDVTFPLGSGKLKLIGLERYERDNFDSLLIDSFADGSPSTGSRFLQTNGAGERIGRFEYNWKMWGGDWQFAGEAAFNRLDRVSQLFTLEPNGSFVELDFPAGTGGVREQRYEAGLTYGRQLSGKLSIQANLAGEYSQLEQTGSAENSRSFQRPKGSLSFAWKPKKDLDFSLELRREVGQLSFGDFLASVSLNDENQNAGNRDLVPHQSWNINLEANKSLGDWGSLKLELRQAWFEDFVDFFPLPDSTEARGNIGNAERTHLELTATIKTDPIGLKGMQFDISAIKRWMDVIDPFTGESRPFSNDLIDQLDIDFRHDIAGSDWAYGGNLFTFSRTSYSRLFETGRSGEGPTFLNLFVEHKDVMGLTVNAQIRNILSARENFERTVYSGPRPDSAVEYHESYSRRIGPIFQLSASGNF